MDSVISEPCYKGTILKRNCRKITTSWLISYNFLFLYNCVVKFFGSDNMTVLYSNQCYNEMFYCIVFNIAFTTQKELNT